MDARAGELLFVGDAGTTEPQARSRRTGVPFANFWRPDPCLWFDADVSFTRARYLDEAAGQQSVPGALEWRMCIPGLRQADRDHRCRQRVDAGR